MITNLVFGGGGVRCLSYISALKILTKYNILNNIKLIIGTSGGAFIALLYCIGYTGQELENIFLNFNISKYEWINEQNIYNFINTFGINNGDGITQCLSIFLKHKNIHTNITFKELYDITKIELVISGTNLTTHCTDYFNYHTTPNMNIILAIRISSCFPLYLIPIKYNNDLYIDGGLLDNMPLYNININEYNNTLCLTTVQKHSVYDIENNIMDYILSIYNILRHKAYSSNLNIIYFNPDISILNFNISSHIKKICFDYSHEITLKFIVNHLLTLITK